MASAWQATHQANGALACPPRLVRLLDVAGAPLRSFGRLSYEIYLTHIFAMWWVVDAFHAHGSLPAVVLPAHLLSLALAWGLGWIAARYWSAPAARRVLSATTRPAVIAVAEAAPSRPLSS